MNAGARNGPADEVSGAQMTVSVPVAANPGLMQDLTFQSVWIVLVAKVHEVVGPQLLRARVARFAEWLGVVAFFVHGLCLAAFSRTAQAQFQQVVDLFQDEKAGLFAKLSPFVDLDVPTEPVKAEGESARGAALGQELDAFVADLVRSLGELLPSCRGDDRTRGLAAYEALLALLESRQPNLAPAAAGAVSQEPKVMRTITIKVFQPPASRQLSVDAGLNSGGLKKLLIDSLGFSKDIKLLGRSGVGNTLFTMKAADKLPEDGEVMVHGAASVYPARALPPVPPQRSPEERLWAFRGVVPRVDNEQAMKLCQELKAGFAASSFQEELRQIQKDHLHGRKPARTLAELAFTVQQEVLPRYGYEASPEGVLAMRIETKELFATDVALHAVYKEINELLGFKDETHEVEVELLECPRFNVLDAHAWKAHLADHGYVVIAGVANTEDVSRAWSLLWDFIEQADESRKIKRSDVNTWQDSDRKDAGWPAGKGDGIIHDRGIGQSELLWHVRSLPALRHVFEGIWGTEDLVVSFDGAGVFRPYGRNLGWKTTKKHWYHVDQAHTKPGLHCIQAQITLTDVTEASGGLVVVPGSHRFHSDILRHYEHSDWDFISLRKGDRVILEGGGGPKLLAAKAGDALLWDSRTVHANTLPLKEDLVQKGDKLIRATVYACMTPAAWCTQETMESRRKGCEEGVTTSHWPHEYHEMQKPDQLRLRQIRLSAEQRRLLAPELPDSSFRDSVGILSPGAPSFQPVRRFRVAEQGVAFRRVPTLEWDRPLAVLRAGTAVRGHVFGRWLRLADDDPARSMGQPVGVVDAGGGNDASKSQEEERWLQISDGSGEVFLLPVL